jgi:hypothetical protein
MATHWNPKEKEGVAAILDKAKRERHCGIIAGIVRTMN